MLKMFEGKELRNVLEPLEDQLSDKLFDFYSEL
jgi:hypothetical protein